jgi:hypothetical protein
MTRTGHRLTSRRALLTAASLLVAGALALASPAAAQQAPPAAEARQTGDRAPANVTPRDGCADCRAADSARRTRAR